MKFTDFEVTRVGEQMVLSCFTDDPPPGMKVQITLDCGPNVKMYEQLFQRLAHCATVYEDVSDDTLVATVQLMKGKES